MKMSSLKLDRTYLGIGIAVLLAVLLFGYTVAYFSKGESFSAFVQTPGQVKSERFSKSARDNIYIQQSNNPVSDYTKNVDDEYKKGVFETTYTPSAAPTGKASDRTAMDAMRLSEVDNDLDLNVARVNRQNTLGDTGITAY